MSNKSILLVFLGLLAFTAAVFAACGSTDGDDDDSDSEDDDATDDAADDNADDIADDALDDADDAQSDDDLDQGDFTVSNFDGSGCLSQGFSIDEDGSYTTEFKMDWDGAGTISVYYGPECLNCAVFMRFSYSITGDLIQLFSRIVGEDGAACNCLYDYRFDLIDIQPGNYTFKFGSLEIAVSLTASQTAHYEQTLYEGSGCG